MLLHHRPLKTLITGKSGSGKTSYFQKLLENGFQTYWKTVFLYDWQGEMATRLNVEPCYKIDDLPEALKTGFVCFDPQQDFEGDNETGLLFFTKWSFEICRANDASPGYPRLLACDEIQLLLDTAERPIEIRTVMQTGRRAGLDIAFVAQQLNELHNKIRSQSTERITFQHEDKTVLDVMWNFGFDPDIVRQLNVGEFLYRNDRGEQCQGNLFKPVLRSKAEEQNRLDSQGVEP